jgi:hypothetical protein
MQLPTTIQGWTGSIIGVAAVFSLCVASYSHFTTDAEAAQTHQTLKTEHSKLENHTETVEKALVNALNQLSTNADRAEINRSRRELKRIKFQLENTPNLTPAAESDLLSDEAYYKNLISCIKKGEKFCDE